MGIWGRLGNVIKSYLNDDESFGRSASKGSAPKGHSQYGQGDPDVNAAYEELDEFLNKGNNQEKSKGWDGGEETAEKRRRPVPAEIREDFAELGLSPEATPEECKAAYKKLLKVHHPDRHAEKPENIKKATEKTARVNAAYKRLEKWLRFQNSSVP